MLAVREGKDAVCARNFSDALQKALFEKRLMGRAVDGSAERSAAPMPELDLSKLMEHMMRAGVGMGGGFGQGGGGGGGGGAANRERDTKRHKAPPGPGDTPFQDPELD
eukprot:COSAG03_NODE_94_length_13170_cov_67.181470_2_plen_108_part_00